MSKRKQIIFAYLLIATISFLTYGNTIKNKYSIDDNLVVLNKTVEKGVESIPEILTSYYNIAKNIRTSYRPIVKISFAIEYEFFGRNPAISHFINILLYTLLALVLFKTLLLLFESFNSKFLFSLIIIILFIANPIHTEVVASLKNRDAILSFLGAILSLYFLLKYAKQNKISFLLFSVISFTFGFYSKPDMIVFAAINPLALFIFTDTKKSRVLYILLLFIGLIIILRILPNLFLPDHYRPKHYFENPLYFHKTLLSKIQASLHSSYFYVKKLLLPHPLLFYYGYNTVPVFGFSFSSILSGIFHISILGYSIIFIKKQKILSFAILFYLISISMFLNFIPPMPGIVAERFVFIASLGFQIAVVYFLFKIFKLNLNEEIKISTFFKNKIVYLLLIIFVLYSFKTFNRNSDWYNDETLYSADIKYLGESAKANEIYATMLLHKYEKKYFKFDHKNQIKEIENHYIKASNIDTSFATPIKRLGFIYTVIYNNPNEGLKFLKKYEKAEPDDSENLSLIALSYEKLKKYKLAIGYYYKTYKVDTNYVPAISKIANYNFNIGNVDSAIILNKKIILLNPNSPLPYENLIKYHYLLKDWDKVNYYRKKRTDIINHNKNE